MDIKQGIQSIRERLLEIDSDSVGSTFLRLALVSSAELCERYDSRVVYVSVAYLKKYNKVVDGFSRFGRKALVVESQSLVNSYIELLESLSPVFTVRASSFSMGYVCIRQGVSLINREALIGLVKKSGSRDNNFAVDIVLKDGSQMPLATVTKVRAAAGYQSDSYDVSYKPLMDFVAQWMLFRKGVFMVKNVANRLGCASSYLEKCLFSEGNFLKFKYIPKLIEILDQHSNNPTPPNSGMPKPDNSSSP